MHRLQCEVFSDNIGVIELHKKFGFQEVGIFKEYAIKNNHYISSIWLQKSLTH
jgi:phosphinothricin acetyltransferase